MNRISRHHFLLGLSFLVFLVGLGMTLSALRRLGEAGVVLRRKSGALADLVQVRRNLDRFVAAQDRFEALPSPRLLPVADAVRKGSVGVQATDVRQSSEELCDGWVRRVCELSFREAPVARVMKGVVEAERGEPPWRLVRFLARASARDAGLAQIVVEMEGIEQSPREPRAVTR